MHSRIVDALVDAENDRRDVVTGGRSRHENFPGARGDVFARILGFREPPGRLDDDIDAQVAPGKIRGVTFFEHDERFAVDDDAVAVELDGRIQTPGDGVVLQEVSERLVVGEVIDRDDVELAALGEGCAEEVAADAAESVDSDLDRHNNSNGVGARLHDGHEASGRWFGRGT